MIMNREKTQDNLLHGKENIPKQSTVQNDNKRPIKQNTHFILKSMGSMISVKKN